MLYQPFGRRTGLRVSECALGTGSFGTSQASAGLDASRAIYEAFVAAGGTTFDTSNIYQSGEAERVLGELLGGDRDDFVVITKYSGAKGETPRPGTTGNSRKTMIRSLEESLTRLKTDRVDVFMPHLPDGVTPIEEILSGLDDLIRAGKVLYAGLSNFPAWRVAGAAVRADLGGLSPLVGIETEYSLAERSADRELLPMAEAHGLGVLLYSPLAGGLLTGKDRRGEDGRLNAHSRTVEETALQASVVDEVLAIAHETDTSAIQVSLAWLRHRAALARTALVPIVGPRSVVHLNGYLQAFEYEYDTQHYRRLDQISAIEPGAPHEDVEAALQNGYDGDRTLLRLPSVPVP